LEEHKERNIFAGISTRSKLRGRIGSEYLDAAIRLLASVLFYYLTSSLGFVA